MMVFYLSRTGSPPPWEKLLSVRRRGLRRQGRPHDGLLAGLRGGDLAHRLQLLDRGALRSCRRRDVMVMMMSSVKNR